MPLNSSLTDWRHGSRVAVGVAIGAATTLAMRGCVLPTCRLLYVLLARGSEHCGGLRWLARPWVMWRSLPWARICLACLASPHLTDVFPVDCGAMFPNGLHLSLWVMVLPLAAGIGRFVWRALGCTDLEVAWRLLGHRHLGFWRNHSRVFEQP